MAEIRSKYLLKKPLTAIYKTGLKKVEKNNHNNLPQANIYCTLAPPNFLINISIIIYHSFIINLKDSIIMKKLLLFLVSLVFIGSSFGQFKSQATTGVVGSEASAVYAHKATTLNQVTPYIMPKSSPILSAPSVANGYSSSGRAPGNTYKYQRSIYLLTPAEMAASGLPNSSVINSIGWSIMQAGTGALTGTLKIYLLNTTNTTFLLSTTWATAISGFTLACNNTSWTTPLVVGTYDVPFTGGSSFTYTGSGLYIAWEFSSTGTAGTVATYYDTNTDLTNGIASARSTSSLPATLTAALHRPITRIGTSSYEDVISVTNIYTTEKVPTVYGVPCTVGVRVNNLTSAAKTFDLTITVKDQATSTTRYTATQNVTALAANSSSVVNFTAWSPTLQENVNITATTSTIAGETWPSNNTLTIPVNVNSNLFGYSYSLANSGGYGFTYPNAGIFASKFTMHGLGYVNGANLVISSDAATTGNTIYAVVMNSSGSIVATSGSYVVQAGDLGTTKYFSFPVPPSFTNADFYIGFAQTAGTAQYYPVGVYSETPQRDNTFYYVMSLSGGTLTALPTGSDLKYGIEAQVGPPPACLAPSALNATSITTNSANLTWTPNGTATAWEYVYGVAPLAQPTGSGTSTGSSTNNPISGLSSGTVYQYYVRSNCAGSINSVWSGPYTFSTVCAISNTPFSESFEGGVFPPACWSKSSPDGGTGWASITSGTTPLPGFTGGTMTVPTGGGSKAAYCTWTTGGASSNDQWLISPQIAVPANAQLSFYMYLFSAYADYVDIKISTTTNAVASFTTTLLAINNSQLIQGDWKQFTIPLTGYAGQNVYIAFNEHVADNQTDGAFIGLDLVSITEGVICPAPTLLTVSNLTQTGAVLGWTDPTGTLWNIDWGLQGFNHTGGNPVNGLTSNSYTIPVGTLTASTSYDFYVQSNCGATGLSAWAGPFTFMTPCNAYSLPFTENFEPTSPSLGCWTVQDIDGGGEYWTLYTDNHTPGGAQGIGHLYGASGYAESGAVFSPELILPAATIVELSFWSYNLDASYYGQNSVLVSTNGWQTYDVVWAPTTVAEATWEQAVVSLSAYAGNTIQLAFLYEGTYAHAWLIDDILVNESPSCPAPTSLTITNLTQTGADLGWTDPTGTLWNIDWGLEGFNHVGGNAVNGLTANSYSIPIGTLTASTSYDFYVQSNCGSNGTSVWAGPFTFTTPCNAYSLPFTEDFEPTSPSLGCWTVQDIDGGGENWTLYTDNHTPGGTQSIGHLYGASGYAESGAVFSPELVLPAATNVELSFWSYNVYPADYGQNSVLVSSDGWQTYDVVWSPTTVLEPWEQAVVSLSAYAGNTIQLAFLYEGTYAHAWLIDDIEVYVPAPTTKTLNVKLFLEGLYNTSTGTMNQAQDVAGPKFTAPVVDTVRVELYQSVTPFTLAYTYIGVELNADGTLTIPTLPGTITGTYYIVIKHRNSIETWSGDWVDFSGAGPFNWDFTTAQNMGYGSNLKSMGTIWAIWAGDIAVSGLQDGIVDGTDMLLIDNASKPPALLGYFPEDVNGDGIVDGSDMTIIDNNSKPPAVQVIRP